MLDADHDTYGDVIPDSGPLSIYTDAPSSVYDRFEYKIPGNADGARDTQIISHMVHQPKLQFRQEHMIMLLQIQHQVIMSGS